MNTYATLGMLKSASVLNISGGQDDIRLAAMIESVSRQVDGYCNRHFYTLAATRYFDGDGSGTLRVHDLVEIDAGGLAVDVDRDRQYGAIWSPSDYDLYPPNVDPTGGHDSSGPYSSVVADGDDDARRRFPAGRRTVRIAGQWGFWRRLRKTAELAASVDAAQEYLYLDRLYGVATGHTVLVGSEQMYVHQDDTGTAYVTRGVNGTTAAAHASKTAVSVYEYPGPVTEAALLQSARLWRRGAASESEPVGIDADVRALISPYRKIPLGIA